MAVTDPGGGVAVASASPKSHLDWGAVFAGAVIAAAVSFLLLTVGSALGLSFLSPREGADAPGLALAIGIALWSVLSMVTSFAAGGYVAGRMRRRAFDAVSHEVAARDAIHGLTVWALGVLVGALLTASAASHAVRAGAEVASAAVGAGTVAAGAVASDRDTSAYFADMLFRGAAAPATPPAPAAAAPAPAPDALGTNRSPAAIAVPPAPPAAAAAVSPDARREAGRILLMGALREEGLSEADRAQLAGLVARETGISGQEARNRVDRVVAQAEQAADAVEQRAREMADAARKAGIIAAFLTVASLLVAAAAAAAGARLGGRHRDEGTGPVGFFG
jgi:hypothetical protein